MVGPAPQEEASTCVPPLQDSLEKQAPMMSSILIVKLSKESQQSEVHGVGSTHPLKHLVAQGPLARLGVL